MEQPSDRPLAVGTTFIVSADSFVELTYEKENVIGASKLV